MSQYLDLTGLNYLWGKIKSYVSGLGFYTKPSTGIPASDIASGVIPTVPTKVSDLTNDTGYITDYTETDPTVPSWAKASTKPTYTASEVGALPDTTVIPAAQVNSDWNASSGVAQILNKPMIPSIPSNLVTGSASSYTIWTGTAAEYGQLPSYDNSTLYFITP